MTRYKLYPTKSHQDNRVSEPRKTKTIKLQVKPLINNWEVDDFIDKNHKRNLSIEFNPGPKILPYPKVIYLDNLISEHHIITMNEYKIFICMNVIM